jgi:hypothetical protein
MEIARHALIEPRYEGGGNPHAALALRWPLGSLPWPAVFVKPNHEDSRWAASSLISPSKPAGPPQ